MITTIDIKRDQLTKGFYTTGSGSEVILIMGSCRVAPYVNYFDEWNKQNGNRFTIHSIDPFNNNWDINNERVDYEQALTKLEKNEALLNMLKSVNIFIHEYYQNAGMFNIFKGNEKNIYQYGMAAQIDISIPNFNDIFILVRDIIAFDVPIKKMAIQDYNVTGKLSHETVKAIDKVRDENIERFCFICEKTDFPEMARVFKNQYKEIRMFWTFNHIAKEFSLTILSLINAKFLKLKMTDSFWSSINSQDLFANNYTYLSDYDHGYSWNEEIKLVNDLLGF